MVRSRHSRPLHACASAAMTLCLALAAGAVQAADIKDVPCRTTAECLAEAARVRGEVSKNDTSRTAELQDVFYWTNRINMAPSLITIRTLPRKEKVCSGGLLYP